jgi:hypothetical protein
MPFGDAPGLILTVSNPNGGEAIRSAALCDDCFNSFRCFRIKRRCGLVEEYNLGACGECANQAQTLPFAGRKAADRP